MDVEITKEMMFKIAKNILDDEDIEKVNYVSIKTKHIKENVYEKTITYLVENEGKIKEETEFNTNQKVTITL